MELEIIINDANIFFDLFDADLLNALFKLPCEIHTVDLVLNEIKRENQQAAIKAFIESKQLKVKSYPATLIQELFAFNLKMGGNLSFTDSTVLYYALETENCRLLTGDRQLRNRAESQGVKVSGIIYVFDKLVELDIITPAQAIDKITQLMSKNPRLPHTIIAERIAHWQSLIR